jgi:outer membrane protein
MESNMSKAQHTIARFLAALFVFGLLLGTASVASAQKIAYVDLQRALNEVDEGKQAKARLQKDFAKKQKKLDQQQNEVKKLKEELEAGVMLSDEVKRQKAMVLQQKMYELQQLYFQLQQELSQAEAKATKKIFDKMGTIIEKIGKEKGYDLILEKTESSVLYAKSGMDITDELVKRFNK